MSNSTTASKRNNHVNFQPYEQIFYERDTRLVAIDLLGSYLLHKINDKILIGKIVETEAYLGEIDPACHFYSGNSKRNSAFYQTAGMSYVYMIYGKYFCLNVITKTPTIKGAVLFRAIEPVDGIDYMKQYRISKKEEDLCNGPGKLTQAFQISMKHNKIPLYKGSLTILKPEYQIDYNTIGVSKRVGISKAKDWNLRYFIINNPHVSYKNKFPSTVLKNADNLQDISYYT